MTILQAIHTSVSRKARLLAAALLVFAATPLLAVEPFTADYQANYMGMQANGRMTLAQEAGNRWKYSLDISGAGARLTLSPAENPDPALWKMGYPTAIVQPDGSFAFTSYEENDGAPPGNYKLLATWAEGDTGIPNEDESAPPPKQLLDAKYALPESYRVRS